MQCLRVERGDELLDGPAWMDAGGGHRVPFTDAVPGHQVGYHAQLTQRRVEEPADGEHTKAVPAEYVGVADVRPVQPEMVGDVVGLGLESLLQPGEDKRQPTRRGLRVQRIGGEPDVVTAPPRLALLDDPAG